MSLRQAAQQALEALESFQQSIGVFRGEFEEEVAALRAALDVTPAQMENALRRKKGWRIMDRETVIVLAREAGFADGCQHDDPWLDIQERFAALVEAHEREECEHVCRVYAAQGHKDDMPGAYMYGANDCANAIRSRDIIRSKK